MSKMTQSGPLSILVKMYILYQKEFIYNLFYLQIIQNWVFYPDFLKKIHNKATYGHLFVSKTSDASHPLVRLRYLK